MGRLWPRAGHRRPQTSANRASRGEMPRPDRCVGRQQVSVTRLSRLTPSLSSFAFYFSYSPSGSTSVRKNVAVRICYYA